MAKFSNAPATKQTSKAAKAVLNPAQEIGQSLMLIGRDFQRRLDADLAARGVQGVSARHRAVFLFLGRNGPSRAVDLAEAAGIRPQSMMKIVHELEEMQWVERREDPADSRAKLIEFTPKGVTLIDEMARSTETVWREYTKVLGKDAMLATFNNLNTLLQAGAHDE